MIEDVSEHSVKENNWNYEKGSDRTMREKKIFCILHQILLGWSHKGELDGQNIKYIYI